MYVAMLEKGAACAEDEIHMACDVAVLKILAATIQKNCVLPTQKAAVAKDNAVAVNSHGQSLTDRASGIFKGNILGGEIV